MQGERRTVEGGKGRPEKGKQRRPGNGKPGEEGSQGRRSRLKGRIS